MTRIVVMSDTHTLHRRLVVPEGDIVVHCGDWSGADTLDEHEEFFAWFAALPHRNKILVAGNHEKSMEPERMGGTLRRRMPRSITYLEDNRADIQGIRFWGSPRTVGYPSMAFTHRAIDKPERIWSRVHEDTDVLVTHGPPYGILDLGGSGQRHGDRALLARVEQIRPPLHLFGHVHEGNGRLERFGTTFVNAAIGDDDEADLSARIHVLDVDLAGRESSVPAALQMIRAKGEWVSQAGIEAAKQLEAAGFVVGPDAQRQMVTVRCPGKTETAWLDIGDTVRMVGEGAIYYDMIEALEGRERRESLERNQS